MGLYDTITCEQGPAIGMECQTKGLRNLMEHYVITKDGRLMQENKEIRFNGKLRFYTSRHDPKANGRLWFEYEANFKYGKLKSIITITEGEMLSNNINKGKK